jgi:hypothetical protein
MEKKTYTEEELKALKIEAKKLAAHGMDPYYIVQYINYDFPYNWIEEEKYKFDANLKATIKWDLSAGGKNRLAVVGSIYNVSADRIKAIDNELKAEKIQDEKDYKKSLKDMEERKAFIATLDMEKLLKEANTPF